MLKNFGTKLRRILVKLVQRAFVLQAPALTGAALSAFNVFAVHAGRASLGVTQCAWHVIIGVRGQFCSFSIGFAVLAKIEPDPVRERL